MSRLLGLLVVLALLWPVGVFAQEGAAAGAAPAETQQPAVQAAETPVAEAGPIGSQKEKVSYCIGLNIGNTFKQQSIDIDIDAFVLGIKDALSGSTPLMTDEQIRATMMQWQQDMLVRRQAEMVRLAQKNEAEGKAFLDQNRQKPGVITRESGLQYTVINEGLGESPTAEDTVTVNYRGTFIDGTEFDSSYSRGEPATFAANGVIAGWTEALQLMKVGSKWQLFIPSQLAYGEAGRPPRIGPNCTLIFEIELLAIEKPGEPAEAAPQGE